MTGPLVLWRALLFNAFVFLSAVVLLSLLVAVLSDTFDHVVLMQTAELIRCRALITVLFARFTASLGKEIPDWFEIFFICFGVIFLFSRQPEPELGLIHPKNSLFTEPSDTRANNYSYAAYVRDERHMLFHFLVPVMQRETDQDSDWNGRIQALAKLIKKTSAESDKHNVRVQEGVQTDIAELKRLTSEAGDRMTRMEAMLEKVTRHLDARRQPDHATASSSGAAVSS